MSAPTKRKRDMAKFYAVHKGVRPGVYHSWQDCQSQIVGFKGCLYKAFSTQADAESFVKHGPSRSTASSDASATKFYGVRGGRHPGVYTDWPTVQNLIQGWKGVKQKSFATRAEAEAFAKGEILLPTEAGDEAKRKKPRKSTTVFDDVVAGGGSRVDESVPAGFGPMPTVAHDGFDHSIKLNPRTGDVEYRSAEELGRYRMQAKGLAEDATLVVYTDGSSRSNGTAGARAGVGVYFGPRDARNVSEALRGPRQTNQRAELTAILRAVQLAPLDRNVLICSDSKYSIQCVTEWFVNWRKNGWLSASKKPVENRDLIETILARMDERHLARSKTDFQWVKGHAEDPGNVAADRLAVNGAVAGVVPLEGATG